MAFVLSIAVAGAQQSAHVVASGVTYPLENVLGQTLSQQEATIQVAGSGDVIPGNDSVGFMYPSMKVQGYNVFTNSVRPSANKPFTCRYVSYRFSLRGTDTVEMVLPKGKGVRMHVLIPKHQTANPSIPPLSFDVLVEVRNGETWVAHCKVTPLSRFAVVPGRIDDNGRRSPSTYRYVGRLGSAPINIELGPAPVEAWWG